MPAKQGKQTRNKNTTLALPKAYIATVSHTR